LPFDEVLDEAALHCPQLQKIDWRNDGFSAPHERNWQQGKLRRVLKNCALLDHVAISCESTRKSLHLDLAAFAPQLRTLHLGSKY
jgi:hypothetical protein